MVPTHEQQFVRLFFFLSLTHHLQKYLEKFNFFSSDVKQTALTKHLQPRASFTELRLHQRGYVTDVLQLVFQVHIANGQRQLRARGAVHTDAVGEG